MFTFALPKRLGDVKRGFRESVRVEFDRRTSLSKEGVLRCNNC